MHHYHHLKRSRMGFSIIELMIALSILTILASIGIPAYSNYANKSKMAQVIHILTGYKDEITVAYQDAGSFPANLNASLPYSTNVYFSGLGPDIQYISWVNDPTSPNGYPKATIEVGLTSNLGSGPIYLVALVKASGIIEFHCGFWETAPALTLSYMPSTCQEQNLQSL